MKLLLRNTPWLFLTFLAVPVAHAEPPAKLTAPRTQNPISPAHRWSLSLLRGATDGA